MGGPIGDLQRRVRSHVEALGGYPQPSATVARLLEHIATVAGDDVARSASALRDMLLLSTCLANQYCETLETGPAPSAAEPFVQLLQAAGRVATAVSAYEGFPSEVLLADVPPLADLIDDLQRALFARATALGIDLSALVEPLADALAAALRCTAPRNVRVQTAAYEDPSTAQSLASFMPVQTHTECSFARRARLWGSPAFVPTLSLEANVDLALPSLTRFVRIAAQIHLDGYVMELPGPGYGGDIDELAATTRRVLSRLSERDPRRWHVMRRDPADPRWFFAFGGLSLYLVAFAPFYPATHANYAFGQQSTYLFFQPHASLAYRISREPMRNSEVHDSIRRRYAAAGRAYDWAHEQIQAPLGECDALRFVKPLGPDHELVRWWIPRTPA